MGIGTVVCIRGYDKTQKTLGRADANSQKVKQKDLFVISFQDFWHGISHCGVREKLLIYIFRILY
jgi:hypothetical protein